MRSAIEGDNPSLKGVLPRDYARPSLDKPKLGQLIDLIATIGLGDAESRKQDILGRVYEYFLSKFAEKEGKGGAYEDRPFFCKSATMDDIASHDFVLTPGRYVGAEAVADDGIPFEEKMAELSGALYQQMRESVELDAVIRDNLERLGFGE